MCLVGVLITVKHTALDVDVSVKGSRIDVAKGSIGISGGR